MEKPRLSEVVVVEGRYDKNTLSQLIDATIIETAGFGIFSDREKLALLRRFAEKRGLIILTDSDGAGFVIRNYLKGALPKERVKHAYIPDIPGREKRKNTPSREGKLGVEGMSGEVLLEALRRSGAEFDGPQTERRSGGLTKADLYALGLSGTADSAARRRALTQKLGLPEKLSTDALLEILNALYDREELTCLL